MQTRPGGTRDDAAAGWRVDVEVVLLRLLPDASLGHRWVRGAVPVGTSPDDCAVELAHAVRHLADLAARDPVVRGQVGQDPLLWAAVLDAARQTRHGRHPGLAAS